MSDSDSDSEYETPRAIATTDPLLPLPVQLGFSEPSEPHLLGRHHFPSKLGGRPAWLDPLNLPPPSQVTCQHCHQPLTFLCQLYCPLEGRDDCFHRTVFVLVCAAPGCSSQTTGSVLAVRGQLPRVNSFYSQHPPPAGSEAVQQSEELVAGRQLCVVCGAAGDKKCSVCRQVAYCSRKHQTADWWAGHKSSCSDGAAGRACETYLLPESELVIEDEPSADGGVGDEDEQQDETLEQRNKRLLSTTKQSLSGADLTELQKSAASSCAAADFHYRRFRRRIAREPHQLIRYQRGGQPLWVSSRNQPSAADIAACVNCGANRQFEFQVMPQMLNHVWKDTAVGEDSVDWGTLAVFTCSTSCAPPVAPPCDTSQSTSRHSTYIEEFVWRQPM